jgi:glycosyltransferase involved in cell wall biosynthesis
VQDPESASGSKCVVPPGVVDLGRLDEHNSLRSSTLRRSQGLADKTPATLDRSGRGRFHGHDASGDRVRPADTVRAVTIVSRCKDALRPFVLRVRARRNGASGAAESAPPGAVPETTEASINSGDSPSGSTVPAWPTGQPLGDGVNVVGYLGKQLALGDIGRLMARSLAEHGVPSSALSFTGAPSPAVDPPFPTTDTIAHRTTLAVMAADQLPVLHEWHPELFAATDRMIAYCFWEMSHLSEAGVRGLDLVDEVWVATDFVRDAFERVGKVPVRRVPLPIAEPVPSDRPRSSFHPLADAGNRTVLGVTFDHFSVLERKNPLAAIDAFTRAFTDDEGPLLVVKTLNADNHPEAHARLLERAEGRHDVRIWDAHLSRADQFAFLSHLDVLVSLHRGEGFGAHLAEAMWFGVPCIATRYSGNLDFMDDTCARLVEHSMIDVADGGTIYPSGTQWADPDLDDAVAALRELVDDDERRRSIGTAARAKMASRPGEADMVETMRKLLAER